MPDQGFGVEAREREHGEPARGAVPSRRRALERLRDALREGRTGPVLITGEAGAGKTWLARRFIDGLPAGWQALSVAVTSTLDAREFLRLVGHALGSRMPDRLGAARLRVESALEDAALDGRNWLLVIDEAHRGSPAVWEEVHVLADQLGRPGGFAALILLGRTELIPDLATRRLEDWATRLSLHLHLMPLDLDEARELLHSSGRGGRWADSALEELHRDALGNPARLLHLAESRSWSARAGSCRGEPVARGQDSEAVGSPHLSGSREPRPGARPAASIPAPGSETPSEPGPSPARSPSLIPTRPPIRLEDGLVEVGWEGDLEAELVHADESSTKPPDRLPAPPEFREAVVEDRYAALQAWTEWTRNRERSPEISIPAGEPLSTPPTRTDPETAPGDPPLTSSGSPAPNVRAEIPHDFAPYSQLFTRLRQSKQG